MALKHKVGDRVRIIKADSFPDIVGAEVTVMHVGPWEEGDVHPSGLMCIADNDYLVSVPEVKGKLVWLPKFPGDDVLACRESNLEAV
jgi:hypothetical protein